ncbi:MAG: zf-HC2 domain-containing protein [Microthrixaceae bacterium]
MTATWHAPPVALARFARSDESIDDVTASSIEEHLIHCASCRAAVAGAADALELSRSWAEVADAIDRPRVSLIERLLVLVGMPDDTARIVGATPGLRLAWLATTVLLAAAAIATARDTGSDTAFLIVAPLVPLGSVALAFLPTEEPGGEAATATPLFGVSLMLRRSLAILAPTFAILAIAGLAQPDLTAGGALWVLPGLALALGSMALATYVRVTSATVALAVGWVSLLASVSLFDGRRVPIADTMVFGLVGQSAALALVLVSAGGLYLRRDRFSTMEVTW